MTTTVGQMPSQTAQGHATGQKTPTPGASGTMKAGHVAKRVLAGVGGGIAGFIFGSLVATLAPLFVVPVAIFATRAIVKGEEPDFNEVLSPVRHVRTLAAYIKEGGGTAGKVKRVAAVIFAGLAGLVVTSIALPFVVVILPPAMGVVSGETASTWVAS